MQDTDRHRQDLNKTPMRQIQEIDTRHRQDLDKTQTRLRRDMDKVRQLSDRLNKLRQYSDGQDSSKT